MREDIADCGEGTHVEISTDEINFVLRHFGVKELEKFSGSVTFLAHNIVDVRRAKCDCRCARKGRTTQQGANNEQHHDPSILARRVDLKRGNKRVWLKGVLVEQNCKVRVVSVRKKIGRYVRRIWSLVSWRIIA